MSLDFAPSIRTALLNDATISGLLSDWNGEAAIFTRRPPPTDAVAPFIIVSPDIAINDEDGLTSDRPVIVRDITVYGDQPDQYRTIEQIGYAIRALFHHDRTSLTHDDYRIVNVVATGPNPAPVDDENTIARMVQLTIQARAN